MLYMCCMIILIIFLLLFMFIGFLIKEMMGMKLLFFMFLWTNKYLNSNF